MFDRAFMAAGLAAGLLAPSVQAALVIDIEGAAGAGFTTWSFSGSDTALNGGDFSGNDVFDNAEQFLDVGDFTDLDLFSVPRDGGDIEGNARLFIENAGGGVSFAIDSVFVDSDPDGSDDLAVGISSFSDAAFSAGDTIRWTGALTVTSLDLIDLDESPLPSFFATPDFGGFDDTLELEVSIGEAAAVIPLPATMPMLLGALGLCGVVARRHRSAG